MDSNTISVTIYGPLLSFSYILWKVGLVSEQYDMAFQHTGGNLKFLEANYIAKKMCFCILTEMWLTYVVIRVNLFEPQFFTQILNRNSGNSEGNTTVYIWMDLYFHTVPLSSNWTLSKGSHRKIRLWECSSIIICSGFPKFWMASAPPPLKCLHNTWMANRSKICCMYIVFNSSFLKAKVSALFFYIK